jgi:hypothetical protein
MVPGIQQPINQSIGHPRVPFFWNRYLQPPSWTFRQTYLPATTHTANMNLRVGHHYGLVMCPELREFFCHHWMPYIPFPLQLLSPEALFRVTRLTETTTTVSTVLETITTSTTRIAIELNDRHLIKTFEGNSSPRNAGFVLSAVETGDLDDGYKIHLTSRAAFSDDSGVAEDVVGCLHVYNEEGCFIGLYQIRDQSQ